MTHKHVCYAHGCERERRPDHVMCYEHWEMVPRTIRYQVYRMSYNLKRKQCTRADYWSVINKARDAIRESEAT